MNLREEIERTARDLDALRDDWDSISLRYQADGRALLSLGAHARARSFGAVAEYLRRLLSPSPGDRLDLGIKAETGAEPHDICPDCGTVHYRVLAEPYEPLMHCSTCMRAAYIAKLLAAQEAERGGRAHQPATEPGESPAASIASATPEPDDFDPFGPIPF